MAKELLTAFVELASWTHDDGAPEAHAIRLSPYHCKIFTTCCAKLADQ